MEELLRRLEEKSKNYRMDKTSSTDIFLRYNFLSRCRKFYEWLSVKSSESKNKTLMEGLSAFDKLTEEYEDLIGKLEFQQNRADYYQLLYESRAQVERSYNILIEKYTKLVDEKGKK